MKEFIKSPLAHWMEEYFGLTEMDFYLVKNQTFRWWNSELSRLTGIEETICAGVLKDTWMLEVNSEDR